MGILNRASRKLASEFNALLDRLEDPAASMAQLLEQMQQQVQLAQREVIRAMGEKKRLDSELQRVEPEAGRWQGRAELALGQGDEGLAREALVQRQRVLREMASLRRQRDEQQGSALLMKAELDRMQQKLRELLGRQHTIGTEIARARAGGGVEALGATGGGSPFDEMRRIEKRIEATEAETEAAREVEAALTGRGPSDLTPAELEARFAAIEARANPESELESGSGVEDELAALKAKIRIET